MNTRILLTSVIWLMCVTSGSCAKSHEDELRTILMEGYNSASLPARKVITRIGFTVLNFDLDEPNQAMDMNIWVLMTWSDPRLAWRDKTKFYRINKLAFPADSVWKPDITLYNHAEPRSADPYIHTQVITRNDGNMTWVPPAQIKASCSMDMTYWPNDVHNCSIKFGSWVHSVNTVDLYPMKGILSVEETAKFTRGEWKVTDSGITRLTKRYSCCPEEYVSIKAWLMVERIAPAYGWIVQAPAVVLGIFTFIIFLLPPSSTERIIFGGFTLILDFFFLVQISQIIHYTSDKTPLIVKYISKQAILTVVSIIISIITIHMTRCNCIISMPAAIKKALKFLSKVLYIKDSSDVESGNQGGTSEDKGSSKKDTFVANSPLGDSDWTLLALVFDRICLLLFIIIFFINLIIYSSVL